MKIENETPFVVEALPLTGPGDRPVLTVIVKGTFTIVPDNAAAPADEQLPLCFADAPLNDKSPADGLKFESDLVSFKPRADVVLVGNAYVPTGKVARALDTGLRVGRLRKIVRVFGDRQWTCGGRLLPVGHSEPKPFKVMPLSYARAFGGVDKVGGGYFKYNVSGRGYFAKKSKAGIDGSPLPNLEDPRHLIKSWNSRPKPAGFGWWGRGWLPRLRYAGTYDEKWKQNRAPLLPEDFRFEYHNGAHPDLQAKGFLVGDEDVEMVWLTPEGRLRFTLSGLIPTCSVVRERPAPAVPPEPEDETDGDEEPAPARLPSAGSPAAERIPLNLDTLVFLPDEKRFYQVWRGQIPIASPATHDVAIIAVWC